MAINPNFRQNQKVSQKAKHPFQAKRLAAIPQQQHELGSYSNPVKIHEVLWCRTKKIKFWTWGSSLMTSRVGYVLPVFDDVIADPIEPI